MKSVNSKLWNQLYSQLNIELWGQSNKQISNQLGSRLYNQLYSQLDIPLHGQLRNQIHRLLIHEFGGHDEKI